MPRRPIVVGIDASAESLRAAVLGCAIARAHGARCRLVHAVPDVLVARAVVSGTGAVRGLVPRILREARATIAARLRRVVPPALVRTLAVRTGRAVQVVAGAARRQRAALVVLGGKHRGPVFRAWSGSTAHYLVRVLQVPVLVTGGTTPRIRRVLVAVDLSPAARATLRAARGLAQAMGARLRVLHVVEPIRYGRVIPRAPDTRLFYRRSVDALRRIALRFRVPLSDVRVRRGAPAPAIAAEAARWKADVVVVGSQGKGFVDRVLIGSTTEWLLARLPTSLLVVPAARARLR